LDTVSRRLELLKLEGLGFNRSEIVKQLSEKYGCSERMLYYDFESRDDWQTSFQELGNSQAILLKTINRFEQIYRQASVKLLTGAQEATQLGALNIMLKANSKILEVAVLPELFSRLENLEKRAKRGVFVP
jgi:transcriptional antiterminator